MKNIFGCFFKVGFNPSLKPEDFEEIAHTFQPYIWGEKGISDILKTLEYYNYGKDLKLILFEFNVNLTVAELQLTKDIGSYRSKEKAIGIPIIVNDENFFFKNEVERYDFFKQSLNSKMVLLENVIRKKKLDTNIIQLKADLDNLTIGLGK